MIRLLFYIIRAYEVSIQLKKKQVAIFSLFSRRVYYIVRNTLCAYKYPHFSVHKKSLFSCDACPQSILGPFSLRIPSSFSLSPLRDWAHTRNGERKNGKRVWELRKGFHLLCVNGPIWNQNKREIFREYPSRFLLFFHFALILPPAAPLIWPM